jgi:phosphoenolpyruvate carboxykinase (GTP)
LVLEAFDWEHGVFLGARTGSETTAAAIHKEGILRRDPMAMLPFCGYNMGDYFNHWLNIGKKLTHPPKIYTINWFRVDDDGNFIWPGFGENIRVLKWVVDRVQNNVEVQNTPFGNVPNIGDLDLSGVDLEKEEADKLFEFNKNDWKKELDDIHKFLEQFQDRMPNEIWSHYKNLKRCIENEEANVNFDSIKYTGNVKK